MKFFNRNKKNKNRTSSSSGSGERRRPPDAAASTTVQATTTTTTTSTTTTTTVGTARTRNVHDTPSSSAAAPVLPAPPVNVAAGAQSNAPSSSKIPSLSNNMNPFDEHDFTTNNNVNNAYESNNPTRRSPSLLSSASLASASLSPPLSLPASSSSSSPEISSSDTINTIRNLVKPTTSSMAMTNLNVVLEELSKQVRRRTRQSQSQNRGWNDDQQLSEIDAACRHIVDSMTVFTQRQDPYHHLELQCEGSRAISLLLMHTFGDDDDDDDAGVHVVSSGGGTGTGTTTATTLPYIGTKEQNNNNNNNNNIHSIHNDDEALKTEAVMIFRRYDVIPTLFQAMERYPDEDELQDYAMAAVAALSRFWDKYYSYYRAEENDDVDRQIGGQDGVSYLEVVLEAMEEYPAHERIPSNGLVILSNVAKAVVCRILLQEKRRKQKQQQQKQQHQRQTKDTVRRDSFPRTLTNAIPTVLQILKDYRDNAEMYEKGLSALVHLTSMNPDGQMILSRQPQAVPVLIKALSAGSSDEKSDRFGNGGAVDDDQDSDDDDFFAASNYNATTRSSIVDLDDDYDLMVQKKNIRLFSLQVLQNISSHPSLEVKGKIILQGGVTSIVRVLREIATMPPPIEATSTNSPYPGANYEDAKRLESSASQIMVTAATSSATDTIIACLRTLVYLSSLSSGSTTTGSSSAYDENRRVLAKTSTKIVLAIVRQYNVVSSADANEILIQSFRFFRNLSMASFDGRTRSRNISPVGAETLTSHGGISTILVCMREHTSHAMIQIQACSTIANLLLFTNNSPGGYDIIQSFNAESGISTMFETIRLHQANLVVLEQAFSALYYLVCSRDLLPDQKHQLLLEENLLVILATMQQYVDESESLCVRGCGIVLLLSAFAGSRNSTAKDAIVAVGGIDVVLATMRRHGLNTEIQEYGSGFLRGICLDSKYHDEFVEKEGISAIVSAMIVHPTEAAIQAYGCDCFIHIANANPQYRKLIQDADGLSIAQDALSNHKTHNAVQTRGAVLVSLLSSSP